MKIETTTTGEVRAGPYNDGIDGSHVLRVDGRNPSAGLPHAWVSMTELGPRGGYRPIGTYYTRERVDELIDALARARDLAFGDPA